jgi:hypothetical protein
VLCLGCLRWVGYPYIGALLTVELGNLLLLSGVSALELNTATLAYGIESRDPRCWEVVLAVPTRGKREWSGKPVAGLAQQLIEWLAF